MEMNCTVDIVCYLTTYTLIDKQIYAIKYRGGCTNTGWRYPPDGDFCSVTGKTPIKVRHFRVKVTSYLLYVQYPRCHCFLCLSAAVTIRWIALSNFHITGWREMRNTTLELCLFFQEIQFI